MDAVAPNALEDELGGLMPEGLRTLSDRELRSLATVLHDAKARQAQTLAIGVEDALKVVPRLMRGPVRKVLFG